MFGRADGFADRLGIVAIVLGTLAIGSDEARHHDADAMAVALELPRPFVGATAGLHADEAGWQGGDEFHQLVAADRLAQDGAALPHRCRARENTDFARSMPTVVISFMTSPPDSD